MKSALHPVVLFISVAAGAALGSLITLSATAPIPRTDGSQAPQPGGDGFGRQRPAATNALQHVDRRTDELSQWLGRLDGRVNILERRVADLTRRDPKWPHNPEDVRQSAEPRRYVSPTDLAVSFEDGVNTAPFSSSADDELHAAIDALNWRGDINQAQCRGNLCRIVITDEPGGRRASEFANAFANHPPWNGPIEISPRTDDGEVTVLIAAPVE